MFAFLFPFNTALFVTSPHGRKAPSALCSCDFSLKRKICPQNLRALISEHLELIGLPSRFFLIARRFLSPTPADIRSGFTPSHCHSLKRIILLIQFSSSPPDGKCPFFHHKKEFHFRFGPALYTTCLTWFYLSDRSVKTS